MQKIKNKKILTNLTILASITFLVGAAFALTAGMLDVRGEVFVGAPEDGYVVWDRISFGTEDEVIPGLIDWFDTANVVHSVGVAPNNMYGGSPFGTASAAAPFFFTDDGVYSRAIITDQRGRTRQRITWEVYFDENALVVDPNPEYTMAMATLQAEMRNNAPVPALVNDVTVFWNDVELTIPPNNYIELPTDYGLTLDLWWVEAIRSENGLRLASNASHVVAAVVTWDGTVANPHITWPGDPYRPATATTAQIDFRRVGSFAIEFDYVPAAQ